MQPEKIKQPLAVYTQPNDGNGDCLFWSVSQALNQYKGCAYGTLARHLAKLHLVLGSITPTQLRQVVYSVFLESHPESDGILDLWRSMLTDAEMIREYGQARALPNKPAADMTPAERDVFFKACMNPVLCWGDETALAFLERLLCIRCLVITDRKMQTRQFVGHQDTFRPIVYIPVALAHLHYQSVTWIDSEGNEHTAFAETELPDVLLYMASRDCSKAKEDYITLERRTSFRVAVLQGELPEDAEYVLKEHTTDESFMEHYMRCRRDF